MGSSSSNTGLRSGFTLIELLVSISIISVLMAVLLPAVQNVREAARRTQCLANVRELTHASFVFEETFGNIPPSEIADGWASGLLLLLPYLDQRSAFETWEQPLPYYTQSQFSEIQPQTFLCPSRTDDSGGGDFRYFFPDGFLTGPGGVSHYAMLRSNSYFSDNGSFRPATPRARSQGFAPLGFQLDARVDDWVSSLRMADVAVDGFTSTLWFAESARVPALLQSSAFNGDRRFGYSRYAGSAFPIVGDDESVAVLHNSRLGSAHSGVLAFAFADGSADFQSKSIDSDVLDRLVVLGDSR